MKRGYSDLITRIRNGYMAHLDSVSFIHTKRNLRLLAILRDEGFISGWSENILEGNIDSFADYSERDFQKGDVLLRYVQGRAPFGEIKVISKGSRRIFFKLNDIQEFIQKDNFKGVLILSTTAGILPHSQALNLKLGGEAICIIK
jgi:small subunit ribosomal protein S8